MSNEGIDVRATLYGAMGVALALAGLAYRASLEPTLRQSKLESIEYAVIFCATIGLINLTRGLGQRLRLRHFLQMPGLILCFAVVLFFSVYKLGMYQFGAFDENYLVNVAYHYSQGFKPVTDYPSPMPPLFMAGIRTWVQLFRFRWANFALFDAGFAVLTCIWLYALFRMIDFPRHWAFLITATVELNTFFVAPFWWYNNTSSIAVVLLLLSIAGCLKRADHLPAWISLSIAFGLVLSSKPNIAIMCLSPCVLFFAKGSSQRFRTVAAIAGALLISFTLCWIAEIPVAGLLRSYAETAKLRGSPLQMVGLYPIAAAENVAQAAIVLFVLLCFIDLFRKSISERSRQWPYLSICCVAALTSIEMVSTNVDLKSIDLMVMFSAVVLLILPLPDSSVNSPEKRHTLVALCSLFLVWSSLFGITHIRIRRICQGCFYEPLPTEQIKSGFFTGLATSPRMLAVQQEVGDALDRFPATTVFFGPRMEFEYAVFHKPLIPGLPALWDVGNQYSPERELQLLANFKMQDPKLLIFMKGEYLRFGTVLKYIQQPGLYDVYDGYPNLTIYIRKRPSESSH